MFKHKHIWMFLCLGLVCGFQFGHGQSNTNPGTGQPGLIKQAKRQAARAAAVAAAPHTKRTTKRFAGINPATANLSPLSKGTGFSPMAQLMAGPIDYFGVGNFANSPLPLLNANGTMTGGMRKFVDMLPGICGVSPWRAAGQTVGGTNNLGQCIPLANADNTTFPGSDYYHIGVKSYAQQMHTDLPAPTSLWGYRDLNTATPVSQYLGPMIVATHNRPVRLLYENLLTLADTHPLPVDTSYMGAGIVNGTVNGNLVSQMASTRRSTIHLHGGDTPWISDGTPHQWITPAGGDGQPNALGFSKGYSFANVPDMVGTPTSPIPSPSLNDGKGTNYYTNQQPGQLLFYHEHAYGLTRLGVEAGLAAPYLIVDPVEEAALAAATVPGTIVTNPATGAIIPAASDLNHFIPLVIQDKTFVPDAVPGGQLAAQDPTWDLNWGGGAGALWFPHVYMPNQNPSDITAANGFGRWDYGPWFWPPQNPSTFVPGGLPYQCTSAIYATTPPAFPPLMCPGVPQISGTPEAFLDTPVVNGTAYPTVPVDPTAYRFRMLSVGNDRSFDLQLYVAQPLSIGVAYGGSGYTAPVIGFTGGGGSGAAATAVVSGGGVSAIALGVGGGGSGCGTTAVAIGAPPVGGITATASAVVSNGTVTGFTITNPGSGYLVAPVVTVFGCTVAPTAVATVNSPGIIVGVNVTNPGTGYTSAPVVTVTDPTGVGAILTAAVNTEVAMVPAVPPAPGAACSTPNPVTTPALNVGLAGALLDGTGNPLNNTGMLPNCWPSTWPTDARDGGVPDPTTAGPPMIQIGGDGGLLPQVAVIPSTPTNYEYSRRSITVTNISTHGLLLGPAERADVIIDFSAYAGKTLVMYNDSPAPAPAFDPRFDYYTGDIDYSATGGAPTTMPGYGPNTRTIMQFQVAATPVNPLPAVPFSLPTLTAALPGLFASTANQVIVPETAYPVANGGSATDTYVRISDTSVNAFTGGPIGGLTLTSGGSGYSAAPAVTISAPTNAGGVTATATSTLSPTSIGSLLLSSGGAGYTDIPTVAITGGGGTGATATATLTPAPVGSVLLTAGGSGYTTPPTVTFAGTGTGATASVTLAASGLASLVLTAGGSGYSGVATVAISGGGGGSGAAGTATLAPAGVSSVTVTAGGTGYTTAPTVAISGGGGTGATATAALGTTGVARANMTAQGFGYRTVPTVTIAGNGCTGVTATATRNLLGRITAVTITNPGSGCTAVPTVTFTSTSGTGAAATAVLAGTSVASVTVTAPGTGFTSPPPVTFTGGGGSGAAATAVVTTSVASLTLTNPGSGYTSVPTVAIVGNGTGAAATATLAGGAITSITLTNGGAGYLAPPTVGFTGGGGTGGTATATLAPTSVASVTLTAPGTGFTSLPTVAFSGGAGSGAAATAVLTPAAVASLTLTNPGSGYSTIPTVTIAPPVTGTTATAAATAPMSPLLPKAIQELFTLDYGRMNATLGVELPFTNFTTQTTIPYGFADPPTEIFKPGEVQLWKITHNGVDSHWVHVHLFDVQVINRVGWDGSMRPPEANEMGFKDVLRMNPLEDIIVALRPWTQSLPFSVPNSYRPLLVTQPAGYISTYDFTNVDPNNNPAAVINSVVNFGWEYVWHCHLLGHEENDFMRAMILAVAPPPPAISAAQATPGAPVVLSLSDTGLNITGFTVQRATALAGPWTTLGTAVATVTPTGATGSFNDTVAPGAYYYQATGNNLVGYTQVAGYLTTSADSAASTPAPIIVQ